MVRLRVAIVVGVITLAACSSSSSTAPSAPPDLTRAHLALTAVASGLTSPVALAWRKNDSTMYVAEQRGAVRAVRNRQVVAQPVLTVSVSHGNEQGLLGLAFSPDGTKLYIDYTDPRGDSHLDEYTMRGDGVDASTRRQVLFQPQPYANHNGGEVVFGPDGMLYIGFGDGGFAGDPHRNGQSLRTALGKILRIDPRARGGAPYSVPADNPFVGRAGARTDIWAYGLRNPWRFSFDRATGDVWIGDVGQYKYEEVDFAPAGQKGIDWGWSIREGLHDYNGGSTAGLRDPIVETSHVNGNCAIVGGYVYRGTAIPALRGVYVYGDNCRSDLSAIVEANGRAVAQSTLDVVVDQLTSFGEDTNGELYAASRTGTVYRFAEG